jgi:hypothetical protein
MQKGKTYTYKQIEGFALADEPAKWNMIEHGKPVVGEHFIVLKHEEVDKTISFILTGSSSVGGFEYECVYSDLK